MFHMEQCSRSVEQSYGAVGEAVSAATGEAVSEATGGDVIDTLAHVGQGSC